jgi:hypothetical protein
LEKHLDTLAHLLEPGIGGRRLEAAARRSPAAGGEVVRWGSASVPLDNGGEVGELPEGVLELRSRSAGAGKGRKRKSHGEPPRRRQ